MPHTPVNLLSKSTRKRSRTTVSPRPSPLILVVDDSRWNQRLLSALLGNYGYAFLCADDGHKALSLLESHPAAAILMDCQMPKLNGYQTTKLIREREVGRKNTPVIACTACTADDEKQRCLDAGMDDFIAKDLVPLLLKDVLDKWAPKPAVKSTRQLSAPAVIPVLCEETIGRLREMGSDEDGPLLSQLSRLFVQHAAHRRNAIRMASSINDREGLLREAHALKGMSKNIGALTLAAACANLEEKLKDGGSFEHAVETVFTAFREASRRVSELAK